MVIRLHQWEISPFCRKVRKILKFKGLNFDVINYNGLRAAKVFFLSKVGKLPVLDDEGHLVQDSSNIGDFLENKKPIPALYPEDPKERALVHFLEDWADESLYWYEVYFRFRDKNARKQAVQLSCKGRPFYEKPLFLIAGVGTVILQLWFQGLGRKSWLQVEQEFTAHLIHLEAYLDNSDYLVGHQQTMADLAVSAQLDEIIRTSHLREKIKSFQKLSAWLDRCAPGE